MRIWRILVAGVAVTVFGSIVGMLTCGKFFLWVYEVEPTNVWKPMEGPPGAIYYIGALVLSIILVLVYAIVQKGIPGKYRVVKGVVFGLCVWAVGILPGMFAMYMFMTVAPTVVVYWTIMGVIQMPLEGLIIAAIYGK